MIDREAGGEPPEGTEPGNAAIGAGRQIRKAQRTQFACQSNGPVGSCAHRHLYPTEQRPPHNDVEDGYRYAAPCLPPEAAALIETQAREIAELRAAIVELNQTP